MFSHICLPLALCHYDIPSLELLFVSMSDDDIVLTPVARFRVALESCPTAEAKQDKLEALLRSNPGLFFFVPSIQA